MSESSKKDMAINAYQEQHEIHETLETESSEETSSTENIDLADQNQEASSETDGIINSALHQLLNTEEEKSNNNSLDKLANTGTSDDATQKGNYQENDPQREMAQCASGRYKLPGTSAESTSQHQQQLKRPWHTVGIVTATNYNIDSYLATLPNTSNISTDNLPNWSNIPRVPLEPGTHYKIRVAPLNSRGRGEYSEPSLFKTAVPGYPETPRNVKITRTPYGVKVSWDQPANIHGPIKEFSVWLNVRGCANNQNMNKNKFIRVYCGARSSCFVPNDVLKTAVAIQLERYKTERLFKISAKNENGYGPVTQVRWIHAIESNQGSDPKH